MKKTKKATLKHKIKISSAKVKIKPLKPLVFGEKVKSLIGKEVCILNKSGKEVIGIIKEVRWADCMIVNRHTGKRSPAIQFLIKPKNGKRAIWSTPFNNG